MEFRNAGIMGESLGRLFGTFLPFPGGSKILGWLGDQEEEYVKNMLPYKDPKTLEEQEENAKVLVQRIGGGVGITVSDIGNILKNKVTSSENNKIKRSNTMKINSNTFSLEKEAYEELETVVRKIAEENEIEDVEEINIKISKEEGVVIFKQAKEKPKGESGDPMAAQTGGQGYSKGKKEKKNKKEALDKESTLHEMPYSPKEHEETGHYSPSSITFEDELERSHYEPDQAGRILKMLGKDEWFDVTMGELKDLMRKGKINKEDFISLLSSEEFEEYHGFKR